MAAPPTAVASRGKRRFIIKKSEASTARIATADGSEWRFFSNSEEGGRVIAQLLSIMGADARRPPAGIGQAPSRVRKVLVSVYPRQAAWRGFPDERGGRIQCRLGPFPTKELMGFQVLRLSRLIAHACEKRGGLLLHGALAEWQGHGVILAGPGGVGKSTASGRLPPPWRTLSDDTTLIVKDPAGAYWAHPWPTWSRVRQGELEASWDAQRAVRLGLIGMLSQGEPDCMTAMSYLRAASELVDVSGQASHNLFLDMDREARKCINRMRFDNARAVARKIPIRRLRISRHGRFWDVIEDHFIRNNMVL